MLSIRRSNVAGARHKPNGMILNLKSPQQIAKAVFGLSSWAISTCQYPEQKSNAENKELQYPQRYILQDKR